MFDLDVELKAWSRRVLPAGCGQEDERRAELEDHVSCEIEVLKRGGMGVEQAFHAAIDRMGDQTRLAKEFAKNRSLQSTLCLIEGGNAMTDSKKPLLRSAKLGGLIIVQALIWAAVMMAVSWELGDTQTKDTVILWLTAGWFASSMLPVALMDSEMVKAECAWIRRRLGFGRAR